MIISKSPFRISFFGGSTDYEEWFTNNGGAFISLAFQKYSYSVVKRLPKNSDKKYHVQWRIKEATDELNKIKQPIVRESLRFYKFFENLEFIYFADLPARSGIGSSSAYCCAVGNCIMNLKNQHFDKYKLAENSYQIENKYLKENVGIQDQIASSFGNLNYVKIKKDKTFKINPIILKDNERFEFLGRLLLVYTDEQRNSSQMAQLILKNLDKKKNILMRIQKIVDEAYSNLINQDIDTFGKLLEYTWEMKKKLSNKMTTKKTSDLLEILNKKEILGYKIMGAGGGGFILAYFKEGKRDKFIEKYLKNKLFIKPEIDESGTRTINY